MNDAKSTTLQSAQADRAIEGAIRIGLLALLVLWCMWILRPFVIPVVWGVIIAIGIYPVFARLKALLGGRDKLAAALFAIAALVLLIAPTFLLARSAIQGTSWPGH